MLVVVFMGGGTTRAGGPNTLLCFKGSEIQGAPIILVFRYEVQHTQIVFEFLILSTNQLSFISILCRCTIHV